jgi:hypothetical protein
MPLTRRTSPAVTVTPAHRVDQGRSARRQRRWPTWCRPATASRTERAGSRLAARDRANQTQTGEFVVAD